MTLHTRRPWIEVERETAKFLGVFRCHWCDRLRPFSEWTIDHIVPRHHGGGNKRDNLVISCWTCNAARNVAYWLQTRKEAGCKQKSLPLVRHYLEYVAQWCPFAREFGCDGMLDKAIELSSVVNKKLAKWFIEYKNRGD